jgi:hypothetical protein
MMYLARELAGVGSADPDMLNVHVLNWDRAIRLGRAMEKAVNTDRYVRLLAQTVCRRDQPCPNESNNVPFLFYVA